MSVIALVVAAGKGVRAGGGTPKQYRKVGGRPILSHGLSRFAAHPAIDAIQVVIGEGYDGFYADALTYLDESVKTKLLPPVQGANTRQGSVFNGLEALSTQSPEFVLIHDAARPFIQDKVVSELLEALSKHRGAITALPVSDSLKRGTETIEEDVDRTGLWRAQTPQAFHFQDIWQAHLAVKDDAMEYTDDAGVLKAQGHEVAFVRGDEAMFKVTEVEDFQRAEAYLMQQYNDIRMGQGYDVHRIIPGDHMWLCGVRIETDITLEGHSDADAGLHALTDAILGAIGAGDIGQHFPPSDPQWKGAASDAFLAHAAKLVADRGGVIGNCDVTLICERPKIGPHRPAMEKRIAEILNIDVDRVSVKATTTEKLGFTGRGEGLAAQAIATVRLTQK
ncbi:MAG: bifunctional 2-C-methyl-D-erythritol 4-phosphate cytidylyltransferase/2-C-methyl-D-erythritol 2,4-cyclodiphosphate synthase [Sphingomonadales bacterium]